MRTSAGKAALVPSVSLSSKSSRKKGRSTLNDTRAVSTNLASYDPKDPFVAFNALLKLLGSLPYRIGASAQYRLSPEEHKLSIHLLTIIEPFLAYSAGAGEMRKTLLGQPTEILDNIVYYVDSKSDLLPLGLSCRRLYDIIFPRHWDYRVIKAKISSIRVWNHISSNKALARNIRYLEVLDERCPPTDEVFPSAGILVSDTDLESTDDELRLHDKQESFVVAALHKMTGLIEFLWSCNHFPVGVLDSGIWPTLLNRCPRLTQLGVRDNQLFAKSNEGEDAEDDINGQLLMLSAVRAIRLGSTKNLYGSVKEPCLYRIQGMLDRCPNLESINLSYSSHKSQNPPPSLTRLLAFSRWPALRSLSLSNLRLTSADGLMSFFESHSHIETLHLDLIGWVNPNSSDLHSWPSQNLLPALQHLHSRKHMAKRILAHPCSKPRPLQTLEGIHLTSAMGSAGMPSVDMDFLNILANYSETLRRLTLTSWHDMAEIGQLAKSVPSLVYLDVGRRAISSRLTHGDKHVIGGPVNNTLEWAVLLSSFPSLTTFHGVRFFYEVTGQAQHPSYANSTSSGVPGASIAQTPAMTMTITSTADRSRIRKNDEIASMLAWKCPKLRRVDHWDGLVENCSKVVILVREKERICWEVRRVARQ